MNTDASPLQVIAQGTCSGAHAALVTTATGATVSSPGGGGTAGTYDITLDPGVPGSVACDAAHLRVFITGIAVANTVAQVTKTSVTVTRVVLTPGAGGGAHDSQFDFVLYKDLSN